MCLGGAAYKLSRVWLGMFQQLAALFGGGPPENFDL